MAEEIDNFALEERCVGELEHGDYQAALATVQQLIELAADAEDAEEYLGLSNALRAAAADQLAVAACMLEVEFNPSVVELDFRPILARKLSAIGEHVLAAAAADCVYDEEGGVDPDALLRRAGLTREQFDAALNGRMLTVLRSYAEARPDDYDAAAYLVKALLREIATEVEALELARHAAERFVGLESSLLLAHALDQVGEVAESRRTLLGLCERFPGSRRPPAALSESYEDEDPIKAANYLEQAYERQPDPMLFEDVCALLEQSEQYDRLAARLEASYEQASAQTQTERALTLVKAYRAMQQPRQMQQWFWIAARQRGLRITQVALVGMVLAFALAMVSVPPLAAVWAAISGLGALVVVALALGNKDAWSDLIAARWR